MFVVPDDLASPLRVTVELYAEAGHRELCRLRDPDQPQQLSDELLSLNDLVRAELERWARADRPAQVARHAAGAMASFLHGEVWTQIERQVRGALQGGRGAIITVRTPDHLWDALPWEFMPIDGRPAAELPGCVVRRSRSHDAPEPPRPQPPADPLQPSSPPTAGRILVAWSSAGGPVPGAGHLRAVRRAAAQAGLPFDYRHDTLSDVSPHSLAGALHGSDVAALHLVAYAVEGPDGWGLALDDGSGDTLILGPEALASLLSPYGSTLRLVTMLVCHEPERGQPLPDLDGFAQDLHDIGISCVMGLTQPISGQASTRIADTLYHHLLVDRETMEDAFAAARDAERRAGPDSAWGALQLWSDAPQDTRPFHHRPWRGLQPYGPADAPCFVGREAESVLLLGHIRGLLASRRRPMLFVSGGHGAGKSSLLQASILPALAQDAVTGFSFDPRTDLVQLHPHPDPLSRLRDRVAAHPHGRSMVLVVDPFEALFVEDDDAQDAFMAELWALTSRRATPALVIALVSTDALEAVGRLRLDPDGRRVDQLLSESAHHFHLGDPAPEQLLRIVREPASDVGLRFEEGLAQQIAAQAAQQPGVLPRLSAVLDQLWRLRRGDLLTVAAWQALGELDGIEQRAEALWEPLSGTTDAPLARAALTRLVHPAPQVLLRRPASQLTPTSPAVDALIEALLQGGLLRQVEPDPGKDGGVPVPLLQIAHASVLQAWPRLARWLAEEREWTQFIEEFEADPSPLQGARLAWARGMWARHRGHVDPHDAAPVLQRLDQAQRGIDKREAPKRALPLVVLAIWTVLGVVLVGLVLWYRLGQRDAQRQLQESLAALEATASERDAALAQTAHTQDRFSLTQATALLQTDPTLAAGLLREVNRPEDLPGWTEAARAVLSHPLASLHFTLPGDVRAAHISTDGRLVLAGDDGVVRIWGLDPTPAEQLSLDHGPDHPIAKAVLSADGAYLLSRSTQGDSWLWALGDEPQQRELGWGEDIEFHPSSTAFLLVGRDRADGGDHWARVIPLGDGKPAFTPLKLKLRSRSSLSTARMGSRFLAAGWGNGRVELWSAGKKRMFKRDVKGAVRALDLSPDGEHIVAVGSRIARRALVWDRDGKSRPDLNHGAPILFARFSPTNDAVLTLAKDGTVRTWSVPEGRPLATLRVPADATITDVQFSPDGQHVACASTDGAVRLARTDGEGEVQTLLHGAPLVGVGFTLDDQRLVGVTRQGGWIWSIAAPQDDLTDDQLLDALWDATRICPSASQRQQVFLLDEAQAQADLKACEQHATDQPAPATGVQPPPAPEPE